MSKGKPSLKETAYNEIKKRIISCEYAPNQTLNEEKLQADFGISRTPIREALNKLEQERLITIMPKKGILVSGFSLSDVTKIYDVRRLVEPYILRQSGDHIDQTENARLYEAHEKKIQAFTQATMVTDRLNALEQEVYELDDAFHSMIINATSNQYFLEIYNIIRTQNSRFRVMSGRMVQNRLFITLKEHQAIMEACQRREWEAAAEKLTEHLNTSERAAFSSIINNDAAFELSPR